MASLSYHKRTVDCLMEVSRSQVLQGWAMVGATLLPAARNKSLALIYDNCPEFTHVIFIDDDMENFNENHILKLHSLNQDIVTALVTLRSPPYKLVNSMGENNNVGEILEHIKKGDIVGTSLVGMAFTLVKREVLDAMREETRWGPIWFTTDRDERLNFPADIEEFIEKQLDSPRSQAATLRDAIEFGQMAHIGTELIGEDIAFSRKAIKLGFKMWVDCGVTVGHIGEQTFDFRDALTYKEQDHENSIDPESVIV